MAITPLQSFGPSVSSTPTESSSSSAADSGPFARVFDHLLSRINERELQADQAIQDLVLGKTDNIHNVMLAVAGADLTFRMILEIRNRLTAATQEILRMQI
jgi:flagellar hook-basal body complex protein FliE